MINFHFRPLNASSRPCIMQHFHDALTAYSHWYLYNKSNLSRSDITGVLFAGSPGTSTTTINTLSSTATDITRNPLMVVASSFLLMFGHSYGIFRWPLQVFSNDRKLVLHSSAISISVLGFPRWIVINPFKSLPTIDINEHLRMETGLKVFVYPSENGFKIPGEDDNVTYFFKNIPDSQILPKRNSQILLVFCFFLSAKV